MSESGSIKDQCTGFYGDPANGSLCQECGIERIDCKRLTKFVEYRADCFGTYEVIEAECQKCPTRVDCKEFGDYACSHKFVFIESECWQCNWRVFCKRKFSGSDVIRQRPAKSVSGIDPVRSDEYEKENDRIKGELRTQRDPW